KKITAGTLNLSYNGAVDVVTSVSNLGNIVQTGLGSTTITIANDKDVNLAGTINVGVLDLNVRGTINSGATNVIEVFALGGSATGNVILRLNHVAYLSAFTVSGSTVINGATVANSLTLNIGANYASVGGEPIRITKPLTVAGTVTINTNNASIETLYNSDNGNKGTIVASNLVLDVNGSAKLTYLELGTPAAPGAISGRVAGAITLGGQYGSFSGLQQTANGTFSVVSSTNLTSLGQPNRAANVTGDLSYETTGTATISLAADVNFGANNVSFISNAALVIGKNVTTTGNITLKSGAGITTSQGVTITATTLSGAANSAVTATNLAGVVNLNTSVSNLGLDNQIAFTVTNGKDFTITNNKALAIKGLVNLTAAAVGTAGNVSLTTTGAGNGITVVSTYAVSGITANQLTVNSVGAVDLQKLTIAGQVKGSVAGAISVGGTFTNLNDLQQTASGMYYVKSASNINLSSFTVNRASGITGGIGAYATGTATITLGSGDYNANGRDIIIGSDVALVIDQNITNGGTVTLLSGAGITMATGKKITAVTLTGQAGSNVTVNTSITKLGDFKFTNGLTALNLTNDQSLNISGVVQGYYNNQAAVFSLANLMVTGGITTSDTGFIRAFNLKGNATDNVTLKGSVNFIENFTANNKDFTLTNAIAVELRGAMTLGTGKATFNMPGVSFGTDNVTGIGSLAAGNLELATTGATTLRNVTLTAGGKISGTVAGALTLVDVTADVSGLTQTANGSFSLLRTSGNITNLSIPNRAKGVTGAISFEVTGAANTIAIDKAYDFGGNSVSITSAAAIVLDYGLTTTGTLTLKSTGGGISTKGFGTATADVAMITAGTLTGSAAGTVSLRSKVDNLAAFTVSGTGKSFSISNAKAFNITGVVDNALGTVNLSSVDNFLNVGERGNAGAINTTGDGKITADTLSVYAWGNSTLTTNVNRIFSIVMNYADLTINNAKSLNLEVNGVGSTLGNIGKLTLNATDATDKTLTIKSRVTAGNVVLTNWGGISGSGAITADSLSGNASDNVSLTASVDKLAGFTVDNNKNFTLTNDKALAITGILSTGTGNISLTTSKGAIAINAAVTGGDVNLLANGTGGDISQTAAITASGTLTATATGAIALDGVATNAITKLGALNGYGIAIKNTKALTLMGDMITYGTGYTITINNSFGATAADKNVTLGANVVIRGGDIMIDLGGGTKAETHANNNGGTFATGNFTLKTFTGAV
ncbi:MAG: hypothetical protein ORN98_05125, partial [Alphaproteobacteria bacterium]|nr:hypothetical protein [Alphaproteobacteria bacterium]